MVRVQEEEQKNPSHYGLGFLLSLCFTSTILYSELFDKYYVGYTSDITRRLEEYNTIRFSTFTHKYRPWKLSVLFQVSKNKGEAIKIERFIKKQKSRTLILQLINPSFCFKNNMDEKFILSFTLSLSKCNRRKSNKRGKTLTVSVHEKASISQRFIVRLHRIIS